MIITLALAYSKKEESWEENFQGDSIIANYNKLNSLHVSPMYTLSTLHFGKGNTHPIC
jgi:hypothetical protein